MLEHKLAQDASLENRVFQSESRRDGQRVAPGVNPGLTKKTVILPRCRRPARSSRCWSEALINQCRAFFYRTSAISVRWFRGLRVPSSIVLTGVVSLLALSGQASGFGISGAFQDHSTPE